MSQDFHPKKTLFWGKNGVGKSAILKSVFRAFDAEPHGLLPHWDYHAIVAVDFSVAGREFTTVRRGDLRALFDGEKLIGAATSSLDWNSIFATATGFQLRLLDRAGNFRHAAPSNFFLPFFINQDGSFGASWETFESLKQFQRPVEQTLEYFARVRPARYFELKADEQSKKIKNSELKVEMATLQRTRVRLRRNTKSSPVKINAKDFQIEIKALTASAIDLAKKQDELRKNIVEDQELVSSLSEQIRLSIAAMKEHSADFKFAAEISATEHKFVCPTCNAKHDDSFHTFLGLAEDARELGALKLSLEQSLDNVNHRLNRNRRKAVDLRTQYSNVQEVLNVKRGKFTFDDFIKSYSANTADHQLASEEKLVVQEIEGVTRELSNIKIDLKVLEKDHDSKAPVQLFRNYFVESAAVLDVETPTGIESWTLAKRPIDSGSRYARSLIAYYSALWKTISLDGDLPAPIVIDSPNQGAQDREHLQKLLAVIASTAPAKAQVILAHEELPEAFNADLVVELSKDERLLNRADFESVAPQLFSYIEIARGSLAGTITKSEDEEFLTDIDE